MKKLIFSILFLYSLSGIANDCQVTEGDDVGVNMDPRVSHYLSTRAVKINKACNNGSDQFKSLRIVNFATENLGNNVQFDEIENFEQELVGSISLIMTNGEQLNFTIRPEHYTILNGRVLFVDFYDVVPRSEISLSGISWIIHSVGIDAMTSRAIINVNH